MFFKEVESAPKVVEHQMDQLYVLIGALKVLGLEGAANAFISRLTEIKKKQVTVSMTQSLECYCTFIS